MSWTEKQEKYLDNNYNNKDIEHFSNKFGKSHSAISSKASRMGLQRVANWSDEEVDYLRENYADTKNSKIANKLGRSESAIYNKAYKIGLKSDRTMMRRSEILSSDVEEPNLSEYERGFICGLVVGEGSFTIRKDGDRRGFSLDIMMKEEKVLNNFRDILGVGSVNQYEDMYSYSLTNAEYLWNVVVPIFDNVNFMNARKEEQYHNWRSEFKEYYNL